jgi:hypothetical protein
MKRMTMGLALALIAGLLSAVPALAGSNCHSWKCVNGKINSLQSQVNRDTRAVAIIAGCLAEVPVTAYGDPNGSFGYAYDKGGGAATNDTTALDFTASGGSVSAWLLGDSCNSATTAFGIAHSARQHAGSNPIAPMVMPALVARKK